MKLRHVALWVLICLVVMMGCASADIGGLVLKPAAQDPDDQLLTRMESDFEGAVFPVTGTAEGSRKYTLMIYLCGSDLESGSVKTKGGAATSDLKEILRSGYDDNSMTVLVMAGGSLKWCNDAVDVKDTAIYEVVDDTLVKRYSPGLVSMGESSTLSSLINYGYENYPAEKHALIIWDHGGGPVGGLVSDRVSASYMTMLTVKEALKESKAAESKLEWIGFDACLMGSVEIAKVVAPYAKYLIASAETEPSLGWNYAFLKDLEKDASFQQTGDRILKTFAEQYEENKVRDPLTLVCMDLSMMADVEKYSDTFFGEVSNKLNSDSYADMAKGRQNTLVYRDESLDLVDLKGLVNGLEAFAPEEAKQLLEGLEQVVIGKYTNISDSSGLSTYSAYFDTEAYEMGRKALYTDLGYSEKYAVFMDEFTKLESGSGMTSWTSLLDKDTQSDTPTKDITTVFNVQLTEDQVRNLASSRLVIVRKTENHAGEECYVLVNSDGTLALYDQQLSGTYVHHAMYVTDMDGNPLINQPLSWIRDRQGCYLLEATLISGEGAETEEIQIQLVCTLNDESGRMEIESINAWDDVSGYYSNRYPVDPEEFDSIRFTVPGYDPERDSDGVLLGVFDWRKSTEWSYTFDIHGHWTLSMLEDVIDRGELYAGFVLTDYQQRTHTNELISVAPAHADRAEWVFTYDNDYIVIMSNVGMENQDNYFLQMTVQNPGTEEIFVHIYDVVVNGESSNAETWIEGSGSAYGIPPEDTGSDVLVIPQSLLDTTGEVQILSFNMQIVRAESEEEIAVVPVEGYCVNPR